MAPGRPTLRAWIAFGSGATLLAAACTLSGADGPLEARGANLAAAEGGCLECHADEGRHLRAGGHGSPAVGCLGCHAEHEPRADGSLGPAGLSATCASCHAEVALLFSLPFAHSLERGMACTDCHPPHGLARLEQRHHVRREACLECHREYRGPYTYPHEGSHLLGCLSCHEAHGSANRRLLTFPDSQSLCLSCHPFVEHETGLTNQFDRCLECHTEVHGSRWDRDLFR